VFHGELSRTCWRDGSTRGSEHRHQRSRGPLSRDLCHTVRPRHSSTLQSRDVITESALRLRIKGRSRRFHFGFISDAGVSSHYAATPECQTTTWHTSTTSITSASRQDATQQNCRSWHRTGMSVENSWSSGPTCSRARQTAIKHADRITANCPATVSDLLQTKRQKGSPYSITESVGFPS